MNGIGVSAVNAYTAHREWASRPPDERYASVQGLYEAARARRNGFALLRPIADAASQERVRDLVLQAYAEYEETATEAAS